MTQIIGTFRIGEDIEVALDATTGDVGTVSAATAKIRKMKGAPNPVFDPAATALDMSVTPYSAGGGNDYPGWIAALGHASSAALAAGIYGIDFKLVIAGTYDITETTAVIEVTEAALT